MAQTEGVAAQQMEKAEQAKQFDKQTNPKTNKQTGQKRSLTAEGVKGTLE